MSLPDIWTIVAHLAVLVVRLNGLFPRKDDPEASPPIETKGGDPDETEVDNDI